MLAVSTLHLPSVDKIHTLCPVVTPRHKRPRPPPSFLVTDSATKKSPLHNTITHVSGELAHGVTQNNILGVFSTRHRYVTEHHHLLNTAASLDCVVTLEKSEPLGNVFLCGYPHWRSTSTDPCARGSVPGAAPMLPLPCTWASCAVTNSNTAPVPTSASLPLVVIVSTNISVYTMIESGAAFHHVLDVLNDIPVSPRVDQRPIITVMGSLVGYSSLSTITVFDINVASTTSMTRRLEKENTDNKKLQAEKKIMEKKNVVELECEQRANAQSPLCQNNVPVNLNATSFYLGPSGCCRLMSTNYSNEGSSCESTSVRNIKFYSCRSYIGMVVTTPRHGHFYHVITTQSGVSEIVHMCDITFTGEVLQLDVLDGRNSRTLPMLVVLTVSGIEMWTLPVPPSIVEKDIMRNPTTEYQVTMVLPVLYTVQPLHNVHLKLRTVPRGLMTMSENGVLLIVPNAPGERHFVQRRGSFMHRGVSGTSGVRSIKGASGVSEYNRRHGQQARSIVKCLSYMNGASTRNEEDTDVAFLSSGVQRVPLLIQVGNNPHNMLIEDEELELRRSRKGSERQDIGKEQQNTQQIPRWSTLLDQEESKESLHEKKMEEILKEEDPFNTVVVVYLEGANNALKRLERTLAESNNSTMSDISKMQASYLLQSILGCTSASSNSDQRDRKKVDKGDCLSLAFARSRAAGLLGTYLLRVIENESSAIRAASLLSHSFHVSSSVIFDDLSSCAVSTELASKFALEFLRRSMSIMGVTSSHERWQELRTLISVHGSSARKIVLHAMKMCDDETMLCTLIMVHPIHRLVEGKDEGKDGGTDVKGIVWLPIMDTDEEVVNMFRTKRAEVTSLPTVLNWYLQSQNQKSDESATDDNSVIIIDLKEKISSCGPGLMLRRELQDGSMVWRTTKIHEEIATVHESVQCVRDALLSENICDSSGLLFFIVSKWLSVEVASVVGKSTVALERRKKMKTVAFIQALKNTDTISFSCILLLLEEYYSVVVYKNCIDDDTRIHHENHGKECDGGDGDGSKDEDATGGSSCSNRSSPWLDLLLAMYVVHVSKIVLNDESSETKVTNTILIGTYPKWMRNTILSRTTDELTIRFVSLLLRSSLLGESHYRFVADFTALSLRHVKSQNGGQHPLKTLHILALVSSNSMMEATLEHVQTGDIVAIESFGRENAASVSCLRDMLEAAISATSKVNGETEQQRISKLCEVCLRFAHTDMDDHVTEGGDKSISVLSVIPNDASVLYLGRSLRGAHRAKMATMCLDSLALELDEVY